MIGLIVKHRQLGVGKILSAQSRALTIRFIGSNQKLSLASATLRDGTLTREVLGLGSRCLHHGQECSVIRVLRRPANISQPYIYEVKTANGELRPEDEVSLEPLAGGESSDPLLRLASLQPYQYPLFRARETLRGAYARMLTDVAGLRSLLGSRVDLRPHQAFVAGTVLLDPRRRFILADEVGLGKTIEAGIVIHDLLAQNPDSRILVLCPSPLTQQWMCELYSKFGGHLFTLLDLHDPAKVDWSKRRLVISSTTMAAFRATAALESISWNMVVVDEVHHLLAMPALYEHVERLSRRVPAVLLLSAIPVHERADELLRLLALLEPERYREADAEGRIRFPLLHEQQPAIGKGLRVLERRVSALEAGEIAPEDVCAVARRVLNTPVVCADSELQERLECIERLASQVGVESDVDAIGATIAGRTGVAKPSIGAAGHGAPTERQARPALEASFGDATLPEASGKAGAAAVRPRIEMARSLRRWAHDVADRYRLSRRIIRNRRARLIEQHQIEPISRLVDLRPYAPHPLELEASDALEVLLQVAHATQATRGEGQYLAAFAKLCWQSACSPVGLANLLSGLMNAKPGTLNSRGADFLANGQAIGYSDWAQYSNLLSRAVRSFMPAEALGDAVHAAEAWRDAGLAACSRLSALAELLRPMETEHPKLILFAGYPGLALELERYLEQAFSADAVTTFRAEQSMEEKEENALRFQRNPEVWLLVSDESGGEGRNFQFAAELVHFDTPWHVARVEQRIGRLDRLGRERVRPDVMSHVLYSDASVEAGLVHTFDHSLGVYRRSISGLEFALRDVERAIVDTALSGGLDAMVEGAAPLKAVVERERAQDDAEAVLDEASFEASAASRFRAIIRPDRVDAGIESAVVDYMRQLTEGRGVRRLDSEFGPGAVVRFQPEKTLFGALPVDGTGTDFLAGNYDGTFRRHVAQQAPRLHFFNVADPLFNAIIGSLDRQATGRTFGIELSAPGKPVWLGLECRFIPMFDVSLLGGSTGLENRIDALYVPKPIAVFIDLNGTLLSPAQAEAIVSLRRRVEGGQHGQTWWDLSASIHGLAEALDAESWVVAVPTLVEHAQREAVRVLAERLAGPLSMEVNRVREMAETLTAAGGRGDGEAAAQARRYNAYVAVLPKWEAALDAVGIVSVNGRLRQGRIE